MDKKHLGCIVLSALIAISYVRMVTAEDFPAHPIAGSEISTTDYVEDAYEAANKGVEVQFTYMEQHLYKVYLQEGFITDIKLGNDEKLKYIGGGDTARWKIDNVTTGEGNEKVHHIFVKPLKNGLSTNIIINTDKRMYQLILESGYGYNPMVSWSYPKSDLEILKSAKYKDYAYLDPSKLKFDYKVSNKSYKWSPADVFRSSTKTYLKMKEEIVNTELPALFVLDDDDKPILVTYRFVDGYFIVDRLVDEAILVNGKKKVKISYKGSD